MRVPCLQMQCWTHQQQVTQDGQSQDLGEHGKSYLCQENGVVAFQAISGQIVFFHLSTGPVCADSFHIWIDNTRSHYSVCHNDNWLTPDIADKRIQEIIETSTPLWTLWVFAILSLCMQWNDNAQRVTATKRYEP